MSHASLFYVGLGYSVAWLNGENVAPEEALGPWTTWPVRVLYRCKDVTAAMRSGTNAIGVWLGGGQYDSTWTHAWFKGPGAHPPLGLRLLLRITLTNGTVVTAAASSPKTFVASEAPFISDDVYACSSVDGTAGVQVYSLVRRVHVLVDTKAWCLIRANLSTASLPLRASAATFMHLACAIVSLSRNACLTQKLRTGTHRTLVGRPPFPSLMPRTSSASLVRMSSLRAALCLSVAQSR